MTDFFNNISIKWDVRKVNGGQKLEKKRGFGKDWGRYSWGKMDKESDVWVR